MIKPFTVSVPDPVLADLKARLARTRWPDSIGKAWDYGTDVTFLRELIDYWQNHFDPVAAVKSSITSPQTLISAHFTSSMPRARIVTLNHSL